MTHVPPPPPPPRPTLPRPIPLLSIRFPTSLSLPPPVGPRVQSQVRVVRPPPSSTPRSGLTGEPRGDPFAPTPIATIQQEARDAATGAEAAMNWRHDRVMSGILHHSQTARREREERLRATMEPATTDYLDALEKKKREKGKKFPTYASDRKGKGKKSRPASVTSYSPQDVRSRDQPASSSSSSTPEGAERYIIGDGSYLIMY